MDIWSPSTQVPGWATNKSGLQGPSPCQAAPPSPGRECLFPLSVVIPSPACSLTARTGPQTTGLGLRRGHVAARVPCAFSSTDAASLSSGSCLLGAASLPCIPCSGDGHLLVLVSDNSCQLGCQEQACKLACPRSVCPGVESLAPVVCTFAAPTAEGTLFPAGPRGGVWL